MNCPFCDSGQFNAPLGDFLCGSVYCGDQDKPDASETAQSGECKCRAEAREQAIADETERRICARHFQEEY